MNRIGAFTAYLLLATAVLFAQAPETRVALVIGNGDYEVGRLNNPPNDAEDMANKLEDLGFSVTLLKDADKASIDRAVRAFTSGLSQKQGTGLFYYAGHGMQVEGYNYGHL